ncbi:cold-shock protein [Actinomadura sp. 3N508]
MMSGHRTLVDGQRVRFKVVQGRHGPQAESIERL